MLSMFQITFPFFALIALGYAFVAMKWLSVDAVGALNRFVLYVALPCMLFKFSAGLDLATIANQPFLLIYGVVGISLFSLLVAWGRFRSVSWKRVSFAALVGVFPNTGFMGVPLVVSMMGERAATPAVAIVLFDMIVTSSLAVAVSTLDGYGWSSAGKALLGAVAGVFSNPMLWSMLAGILFAFMHWPPGPLWHEPIWLMADAATPVALFTMGGILARPRVVGSTNQKAEPSAVFVAAKLAGHPLLMCGAIVGFRSAGGSIEPWVAQSLVLLAALPSASNVSFLAERMGGDAGWVARIILWTTVGAFGTFSLWGWAIGAA
jgi:malonate transporter and related proteins